MTRAQCRVCGNVAASLEPAALGTARGNTRRFKEQLFELWRCPACTSINSLSPVDFADIYRDYPLNRRRLDVFARGTLANLRRRLEKAGITKSASLLDFGCGNGLFVEYLRAVGYRDVTGFDPYVAEFRASPQRGGGYDCVVANDVIEHVEDPRALLRELHALTKPGGTLYVGTADSAGVDMRRLDGELTRLHQPFHRVIIAEAQLAPLIAAAGFEPVTSYHRSYMDTWFPFINYRFLDELAQALGNDLDRALEPSAPAALLRQPRLLFYAFFGRLVPSASEPAVIARRVFRAGDCP